MKLLFKILPIILFLFLSMTFKAVGQIMINEFMSDNESTIADQDEEYSDWIELYNKSNDPINLLNYGLSDKSDELDKWKFPNITIPSHSYLLIFASGKDRLDINELHTNFKISSDGEMLYLSNQTGQIIDVMESIELSEDQSYGRIPDGTDNLLTFDVPTANSTNDINNKLTFSNSSGFYTNPFYQKITSLTGDMIFYTVDGSVPNENSKVFLDSLIIDYQYFVPNVFSNIPTSPEQSLISSKAWKAPNEIVDKASILRYASFNNGVRTSRIYTHTYLVDTTIFEKYDLPVISLVTDSIHFFDEENGIFVPGIHYDETNPQWSGNYFQRGDDWEKPVHIEYYEKDGTLGFSQDAGMKIHGGKTRQAAQKSLKLYARNEYGKKYFDYPLMPHREHEQYKRFVLRTTMGTWHNTLLNDVLAHEIARGVGINFQDYRPAIVFINGEYWGIHTIRDKIDERYIGYSYGLDKDSVVLRGYTNFEYFGLLNFMTDNDLSVDAHYDHVKTKIDIENFIDYHIIEMFTQNGDWPANNLEMWKEKDPAGKWRWILYDLDGGFANPKYNMFEHMATNDPTIVHPNSPSSTFIYRNLIKNERFKNQFINRYAELLNTDFQPDTLNRKIDQLIQLYEPEVLRHFARWNYRDDVADWKNTIDVRMRDFIERRPCIVEKHLSNFFGIDDFGFRCVPYGNENAEQTFILAPNPNDGNLFIFNKSSADWNGDLLVMDMFGRIVHVESDVLIYENEKSFHNFPHLPSNTYFLIFKNENFKEVLKFVFIK